MATKAQKLAAKKALISYWQDVAERASKTFAQAFLGVWYASSLPALIPTYDALFNKLNWQAGIAAAVASVLMNYGGKNIGDKDTASFLPK